MAKRIYITRDVGVDNVELWRIKPVFRSSCDEYWPKSENDDKYKSLTELCYKDFENITGFKLKEGECKAVEIVVRNRK